MLTGLGQKLRAIRIERDELIRDMSDKLGMSPAQLSSIEHGLKSPPDDLVDKIKKYYGEDLGSVNPSLILNKKRREYFKRVNKFKGFSKYRR